MGGQKKVEFGQGAIISRQGRGSRVGRIGWKGKGAFGDNSEGRLLLVSKLAVILKYVEESNRRIDAVEREYRTDNTNKIDHTSCSIREMLRVDITTLRCGTTAFALLHKSHTYTSYIRSHESSMTTSSICQRK